MNEKVLAYQKKLEKQLKTTEEKIALYERSKSRILMKLKDVEESYAKELKRGSVKVSKIAGVPPKEKTKVETKPVSEVPAPAAPADPAPKEKEKSKLTFW